MIVSDISPQDLRQGFIVIEGVNGAGKSSIISHISELLIERKKQHLLTLEPGGSITGKQIREILLNRQEELNELTELFLFCADRNNHVTKVIKPALENKQLVICDRYYYSTLAFQGYGRGVDLNLIHELSRLATDQLEPDLVILLDLDPKIGLSRNSSAEKERDSFEEEELIFHEKIRNGFQEQARNLPTKFVIIDASQTLEKVKEDINDIFDALLNE